MPPVYPTRAPLTQRMRETDAQLQEGVHVRITAAGSQSVQVARGGDAHLAPALTLVPPFPVPIAATSRAVTTRTVVKRAVDVVVAGAALLAVLPLMLMLALAVKIESRGPVFFRCARAGFRGRTLRMLKFRKMRDDAAGIALTTSEDERFTRIGSWLARLKLDELPQLWHVVRGDMSLVGPRPEDAGFVDHYSDQYDVILSVRPGIIGLSQLAFAQESRILDPAAPVDHYVRRILPQKVMLDMMYVQRHNLWLDLKIIYWSIVTVLLRREVAVARDTGSLRLRKRP
jgi:lipopolysaccharide/colanic/teichoic acid biosynthesis glycosyltransferase